MFPIAPLRVHPPVIWNLLSDFGGIESRAADKLLTLCEPLFVDTVAWNSRRIYMILVFSYFCPQMRQHVVSMNRDNRWVVYLTAHHCTDAIVEKHLAFKTTALEMVYEALDLLFIL